MTPTIARLAALGLTIEGFSRLTGYHPTTVRNWHKMRTTGSGRRPSEVPPVVALLLDAWERHPEEIPTHGA